jgi:acyl carrier protein
LGLDSVALVTLAFDLEKWLGYRFRSNPLNDHPTIAALSRFLAQQAADAKPAV